MNTRKKASIIIPILMIIFSCSSLAPGMHMETRANNSVYIESLDKNIEVKNINLASSLRSDNPYKIGNGDQVAVTIWGIDEIFPQTAQSNEFLNLRTVNSEGQIYFPFIGMLDAKNRTQDELRDEITMGLSNYFNDPQVDVTVAGYNSQKIYIIGEVNKPQKINLTDIPLSLSDAIGMVDGLNNNTSNGAEVFIIRQGIDENDPEIFLADMSSPAYFLDTKNFYLEDNDIIYVNSRGIARWNRVISQFFPFSSLVTAIDNLNNNN